MLLFNPITSEKKTVSMQRLANKLGVAATVLQNSVGKKIDSKWYLLKDDVKKRTLSNLMSREPIQETWKHIIGTDVWVSDKGRFKYVNHISDRFLFIDKYGRVKYWQDNHYIVRPAAELVAIAFLSDKLRSGLTPYSANNNLYDARVENIAFEEHYKVRVRLMKLQGKRVIQMIKNDIIIDEYPTINCVAETLRCDGDTIKNHLANGKPFKGCVFRWSY